MQHLNSKNTEEDVDNEVPTKDLLHRSTKSTDVGSLAEGKKRGEIGNQILWIDEILEFKLPISELLDQTFFWTATYLEYKLRNYQCYYNEHRCHSSRNGATPTEPDSDKVVEINN